MSTAKHEVCVDCDPPRNDASHGSRGSAQPSSHSQAQAESSTSTSASATAAPSAPSADMQPPSKVYPAITIEFCDRCRWAPRATWIQTELFLTFPTPTIQSITLIPLKAEETGGRFRVWLDLGDRVEMVWDRKTEGGFPELKILKQKIRNLVSPDMGLGHSDKAGANGHGAVTIPKAGEEVADKAEVKAVDAGQG
ncbi:Rdx family-domain-containing protein [Dioszegia hungarica]|uniref:Rdx family-domain-containing protein n=1 Tax=Dioszegia hungarica TaxID=4972 RepID=A0AA38HF68_9TREE|nr:Rdx family-domain-containing protein [Dioszegia hungarica]KAI9637811.1 Rdx family-domain-containing protein [Dioszegia hungarica]